MDAHDFVSVSARRESAVPSLLSPEDALREFLAALLQSLRESGCAMVGHIKGMLDDGGASPLFFSVTSFNGAPQLKGGPLRAGGRVSLSVTAIVAGMTEAAVSGILEESLLEYFM